MSGQSKVIEKTALCIKIQILQSFWKNSMLFIFFVFHYFLCFLQSICLQAAIAVNKKIWIKNSAQSGELKSQNSFCFFSKWFPYFFVSQHHVLRIFRYSCYILEKKKKKKQQISEDSNIFDYVKDIWKKFLTIFHFLLLWYFNKVCISAIDKMYQKRGRACKQLFARNCS